MCEWMDGWLVGVGALVMKWSEEERGGGEGSR